MADDLRHLSLRLMIFIPIGKNLHLHFMAAHCAFTAFFCHKNIGRDALIIRNHKAITAASLLIRTDQLTDAMLQNLHNRAFLPFSGGRRKQQYPHRIFMQCTADMLLRNKNIFLAVLHLHKSKSTRMRDKTPDNIFRSRFAIFSFYRYLRLSLQDQCIQHILQLLTVFFRYLKQHCHLF